MKQNDESYLDSLLENVSANSDNLYRDMLNNDADSFQMDEKDLEDFDLNNILEDLSFDVDEDIALDDLGSEDSFGDIDGFGDFEETFRQMNQEWEQESEQTSVEKDKDDRNEEKAASPEMEMEQIPEEEVMESVASPESLDSMTSSEEDSPFEDNLMESLLAEEVPEEVSVIDSPEEPPIMDFDIGGLEEMPEMNSSSYDDSIADLDDLIGLLSEEDKNPEALDNLPIFDEAEEDIFSIHSLDEDGDEKEDNIPDAELLDEDSFLNDSMQELLEPKKKEQPKEKKPGLFKKMFGNVHDEKAQQQQRKQEEAEAAASAKSKEQKKAEKEEKKRQQEEVKKEKTALEAQKKSEKAAAQKAKSDAKKAKKVHKLRVVADEDEGRINRLGATLVFLFFGIIAAGIILGTDSFSYTQSITKATEYFGTQKYNNAYDEVRGVEVKEKDEEIYDKIITVMYVNKQLNSYNNYYNMQMYPEALDSLLKGLERYDEYISIAKELGIKSDLDYVRKQILGELNSIFELSEKDSYRIIDSDSQEIYSQKVIKAASIE